MKAAVLIVAASNSNGANDQAGAPSNVQPAATLQHLGKRMK
jgi:hypothetical protein